MAEAEPCTYEPPCAAFEGVDVTLVRDLTVTPDFIRPTHGPDAAGTACAYP